MARREQGADLLATKFKLVTIAQLRSSAGQRLAEFIPEAPKLTGHAVQARVYAEDPKRFLPSPGPLREFSPPRAPHIRVETGYRAGREVTPHYDPLLAKVIARGATRHEAIDRLVEALGAFRIEGIKHNIPALCAILASEEFREGRVHTGLAAEVVARTPAEAKP